MLLVLFKEFDFGYIFGIHYHKVEKIYLLLASVEPSWSLFSLIRANFLALDIVINLLPIKPYANKEAR